jgi:hypothetical protein
LCIATLFAPLERKMSKESPPPSPSKVAAAAAASAAVEPDFDIVVPSLGPDATLEQRQLAEFNQWVHRYNIYQHQLEAYWRGRLQAEADDGNNNAADTFQSKKGSINTDKWMRRYEELVSVHMMCADLCLRGRGSDVIQLFSSGAAFFSFNKTHPVLDT